MKTENKDHFIQALIERYSFADLSAVDKAKVLANMTAEEYEANRQTVLAATAVFAEAGVHEPKALLLEEKQSILLAPIPLYQMLIGIAAMALFMLLVIPIQKIGTADSGEKYVTVTDTIIKEVVSYDTIEKIIEKPVLREKVVYVPVPQKSMIPNEAPRLLNVPRSPQSFNFSETAMQNKGVSLKDDTLLFELPRIF